MKLGDLHGIKGAAVDAPVGAHRAMQASTSDQAK